MSSLGRILALSEKEVLHVARDPRTLYLALAMPVLMLILFGFGVSFDLDHVPIAVLDRDHSAASREMLSRFFANDDFLRAETVTSPAEAERVLVAGRAIGVLSIESGFSDSLVQGQPAAMALWIDGSDPNSAIQARAKAELLAAQIVATLGPGPSQFSAPIEVRTFTRFNPQGLSAIFLVPGIAGYILAIIAVLLTALTVAREWEQGSMAQLFSTPVTRFEIVIGKLLPYLALSFVAVLLVIAMGGWVFDVPFRGSMLAMAGFSLLFLAGTLGQGLLISVATRNQMVATQLATLMSVLPSLLLSGFMFPIDNMPIPLQGLSYLVPARYYIEALRGVLLRGSTFVELWPQALGLILFAALMIGMSIRLFRRTVA